MKIVTVVGARPQFIKAAVLSRVIRQHGDGVEELLVHTGQHFDANMSDVFFLEMEIPEPARHLGIGGGSHGQMTGRMLEAIEAVLQEERPDWVLVYGDTNSTLAGALAAVKLRIPVAHVEAGLRSFNRAMPEEINRVLTDHASDLLFAPTETAVRHLIREGIDERRIEQVGDVMLDAVRHYLARARASSDVLVRSGLEAGTFALATVHRAENTDDPERLAGIVSAINTIAAQQGTVVLPLHPRTKQRLESCGDIPRFHERVMILPPVGYFDMLTLEADAAVIMTDSGGVQKEAYFHGVPCVTMRDETEWTELIEAGANTLAGVDSKAISRAVIRAWGTRIKDEPLYGTGDAGRRILARLTASNRS